MTRHQRSERARRRNAESRGRWAEQQAANFLKTLGFSIQATRAKSAVGEIDIIAKKTDLLVFVEVKYRAHWSDGIDAILPRQQHRIAQAAEAWLATQPDHATFDMRFDAIIVNADGVSTHIEDAFRPE